MPWCYSCCVCDFFSASWARSSVASTNASCSDGGNWTTPFFVKTRCPSFGQCESATSRLPLLQKTRWHWNRDGVLPHVRAAFRKVLQCRTPALGAEVFASENRELIVYHTCKSRACPSCGYWATKKWIPERVAALPPIPYKGITFSMPDVLWRVCGKIEH